MGNIGFPVLCGEKEKKRGHRLNTLEVLFVLIFRIVGNYFYEGLHIKGKLKITCFTRLSLPLVF